MLVLLKILVYVFSVVDIGVGFSLVDIGVGFFCSRRWSMFFHLKLLESFFFCCRH